MNGYFREYTGLIEKGQNSYPPEEDFDAFSCNFLLVFP
jgi:hypothetical protein